MRLADLFAAEPERVARFGGTVAGIHFDFSKSLMSLADLDTKLVDTGRVRSRRDDLCSARIVNVTEGRAATHMVERGVGPEADIARTTRQHQLMERLCARIEAGELGAVSHVIHIGIGGSALGPKLLLEALSRPGTARREIAVISNVDGCALEPVLQRFDPAKTLILAASKTFTTLETLTNLESVLAWMEAGGVRDPIRRCVALTAAAGEAEARGVLTDMILPFDETVGGRYSLWSSIGMPLALAEGTAALEELRSGAAAMDRHFLDTEPARNMPLLAALIDHHHVTVLKAPSRAVFAYDQRLESLADYLQQLEMESNGKGVTTDGKPVTGPTGPVIWGGVGTDAQHAVFQLLHQGTHLIPVEFVACIEPGHSLDPSHHHQLLANCLAQGAALMKGKPYEDMLAATGDPALAGAKTFSGNRPSATILLDRLSPFALGALIAFYEHRTFSFAALCDINPFDQMGVELGKQMARAIMDGGLADPDPSTAALIARALPATGA